MSRFPLKFVSQLSLLALAGCMYPPMYQQGPYGQQMYGPQGNFVPSGTLVVPPSNAAPYQPGGSTYSTPGTPTQADDFNKPVTNDSRYFTPDDKVPLPSDAGKGSGSGSRPFSNDLDFSK